jgi:plasmid stability protein
MRGLMKKENLNDIKNRMIHVRLPEDLHKRLRIRAAETDQTIQDWVVAALQKEIDRQSRKRG